jgi:hypothetical protein
MNEKKSNEGKIVGENVNIKWMMVREVKALS